MTNMQDLISILASTASTNDDSYKSIQEMLEIITQCVEVDPNTGEIYIRVKDINS